jgi:hypothetical protein
MRPPARTTATTTLLIVVTFIRALAALGAIPFTINPASLTFVSAREKCTRALLMWNIFAINANTVYACMSLTLILSGYIPSESIGATGLHIAFAVMKVAASVFNDFLVWYENEFMCMLNQFVQFWRQFERKQEALSSFKFQISNFDLFTPPMATFCRVLRSEEESQREGTGNASRVDCWTVAPGAW